ncbi:MAG: hypothetical protein CUN57_02015, partial [Phototrophicales bacterium]
MTFMLLGAARVFALIPVITKLPTTVTGNNYRAFQTFTPPGYPDGVTWSQGHNWCKDRSYKGHVGRMCDIETPEENQFVLDVIKVQNHNVYVDAYGPA